MDAQKSLVLILARELAARLGTPAVVADATGATVFVNEAAEHLLPVDTSAAVTAAFGARRPVERIADTNGGERTVALTALPLMSGSDEPYGALCLLWEP